MFRQKKQFSKNARLFSSGFCFGEGVFPPVCTPLGCFAVALSVFSDMFFTCSDFKGLQPVRLLLSKEVA